MRRFALLTALLMILAGAFMVSLPDAAGYVNGIDDGPPQMFTSLPEASRAAGYDLPNLGSLPGWELTAITVTPVYYQRKLLESMSERPRVRRVPGGTYFIGNPPPAAPPKGVRNYVHLTYESGGGTLLSLAIQAWRAPPSTVRFLNGEGSRSDERIRIGDQTATLTHTRSEGIEVMTTYWRHDGVPLTATAVSLLETGDDALTKDEFLRVLEAVR